MRDSPAALAAAEFCYVESPNLRGTLVLPVLTPVAAQAALPLGEDLPATSVVTAEGSPAARHMAASITTALVEVIAGRRGPVQLDGWVSSDVLRLVERLRFRHSGRDLRLCSLRLQFPTPDVVEVCARLSLEGYGRAAALRISRHADTWRATSLVIALPAGIVSRAGRA